MLKAFDFSGKELWARDIQKDYGEFGLNWGYASSPLLHQGALYVQVLHGMNTDDPSYVIKVDGASGKTLWRVERPTSAITESPDSYTTPTVLQSRRAHGDRHHRRRRRDRPRSRRRARSSGAPRGLNPDNNPYYRIVASPFVAGDLVIAPTRVKPLLAIRAGGRGDVTRTHRAWSFDRGPDVPTPVSDGKLVYIVGDSGVVHALDLKTGGVVYGPVRLDPALTARRRSSPRAAST